MNLKITKRIISILCAAVMSVSAVGASVGAASRIGAYPGLYANAEPPANLKNAVNNLNNTLTSSTNTIKKSMENIEKLLKNQNNEDLQMKLVVIYSQLEYVINTINKWNNFSIDSLELANKSEKATKDLKLNDLLNETKDINRLDSLEQFSNKIYNEIKKIDKELTDENQNLSERAQIWEFVNNNNDNDNNKNEEENKNKNKTKEELDAELAEKINKIKNSNEPNKQKIDKIVKALKERKFNDYNKQLNIILPIVDSLHIAGDANANIEENKELRNNLKDFLLQSVEEKINEKIEIYNENEITRPMANYINNVKLDIAGDSVDTVIKTTFHGKYVNAEQLFDIVNINLSLYEEDFKNSANDKNMVKDIDNLSFVKLLDNISNEKYIFDSKKESAKFDIMFRQYAQRITGMKTNLESEAGYGEHKLDKDGKPMDIEDADLIGLREAYAKWVKPELERYKRNRRMGRRNVPEPEEDEILAKHYIRDKVVKDNLDDVLKKYKSLNDLKTKINAAMSERVMKDIAMSTEEELKQSIDEAKEALDDFQNRVAVIDDSEFVIIED